ncbi:uncharacterized protein LOC121396314 [Xenopus laevis]|uniref:Uncharacterized protein LOC121396314 n=1 Tax=Xenopus laevis TaxID=8355 RepID=A0A8J1LC37_XENLA|nr:uncharacterized protein LOC121396314 [Xenopus laevis]
MLLGRDIIRVHKVRQQINGPHNAPYAHRLDTGWVIVGNVCLKGVHRPDLVHCLYTRTSEESCRSLFPPCPYFYNVRENYDMNVWVTMQSSVSTYKSSCKEFEDYVSHSIFQRTTEDETVAPSLEDLAFMKTMKEGFYRAEDSSWVAPLPFKPERKQLPNNKEQVLQRFRSLQRSLKVKPEMRQHFFAFMGKVIQNGHAEIAAPVTIQGKVLLRDLTSETQDWDAPLPEGKRLSWEDWKESLHQLKHIQVTRPYVSVSCSNAQYKELCVFSDASTQAIAAVAYLKVIDSESQVQIGFVLGKAKLAPCPELTVPRLELCAAVLAVDIAAFITKEIDTNIDSVSYFTDSRIVLGYICNEKRRFYVFVSNRVQRIRRSSLPEQWHYVSTESNPADLATRSVSAAHLKDTMWFTGPPFLSHSHHLKLETETFTLVDPAQDTEIRPQVTTLSTTSKGKELGSGRFCRFSSWNTLTRALARLIHVAHLFKQKRESQLDHCKGWHLCKELNLVHDFKKARTVIIQNVQKEIFAKEIQSILEKEGMPNDSPLRAFYPFIDENGLLRVGGRLRNADLGPEERNPIIVPEQIHHSLTLALMYLGHGQSAQDVHEEALPTAKDGQFFLLV